MPTLFVLGYICCNEILNDLMVHVFAEWEAHPRYHSCNIQAVANMLQVRSEQKFNTTFETIVAYADFAEKVHFSNDLICKIELGGRYALAYGTARNVQEYRLPPINNRPQYGPMTDVAHALFDPAQYESNPLVIP
ncbi:ground-like domain protein [Cooperia oncophora]